MGTRLKRITQILSKQNAYMFPRTNDQFDYSPDHSYNSLEVDIYDLNSQVKRIHRRVFSQAALPKQQTKSFEKEPQKTLSPLKIESIKAFKNTVTKFSPQRFFMQKNSKPNGSKQKLVKVQFSQIMIKKNKPLRMHTETIENITKYRLG